MLRSFTTALVALGLTSVLFAADTPPTLVQDVDQAARNSIQFEYPNYLTFGNHTRVDTITHGQTIYTVPAGKLLVIDAFEMNCDKPLAAGAMFAYANSTGSSNVRGIA